MFDNLREQANSSPFYEEEAQFQQAATPAPPVVRRTPGRLLGMTATQRFVLVVMLMLIICLLGSMALLITGKIVLY